MTQSNPPTPPRDSLRLLGIIGGLTPQPSVSQQPVSTLIQWQAQKTSAGAIHLVGFCTERREGRASTAVVTIDTTTRRCMTASGRVYVLSGPPGQNADAQWVWQQFAAAKSITDEADVSAEMEAEFAREEPRP
jgi:hypothetical protein